MREPLHLHFLCNTLHALQGVVRRDPERAERMLDELCDLVWHLLHSTRVAEVSVREEVAALGAYARLQKLRFEDRLEVVFRVDRALMDRRLPGFLLYPLVENAVKFGMHTGPVPARVRVTVESDRGAGLVLTVSNTGQLVPDDRPAPMLQGSRIALDDLRERLAALYPGRHQFTLEQDDGWVRARVRIGAAS